MLIVTLMIPALGGKPGKETNYYRLLSSINKLQGRDSNRSALACLLRL